MKITKEMAAKFHQEAQEEQTQREQEQDGGPPVVWLGGGSWSIRPYPEIRDGRLLTMETMHTFRYENLGRFVDNENGDLQKEFDRANANMGETPWYFGSQELGKLRCVIIKTTAEESEYLKVGEPVILAGGWHFVNEWKKFVAGLEPSHIVELLDPDSDSPMIQIDYKARSGENKASCSISVSTERAIAPELPDEFPNVSECYITKQSVPSAEQLTKIRKQVSEKIAGRTIIVDPKPAETNMDADTAADAFGSPQPQADEAPQAPAGVDTSLAECQNDEYKEEYPNLRFGNRPDEPTDPCFLCRIEAQCMEATAGG